MANTNLYFSLDANERAIYPARNFLGLDMTDANTMQVSFKKEDGSANAAIVSLTIAAGKAKEAAEVLAGALAGQSRGLTIIADTENSNFLYPFTVVESIA
jgi:hypothetical protein|tara:strand:+ start:107 stop:406 length:300 start_codon:yes stop_codon:yes gene_type:complete